MLLNSSLQKLYMGKNKNSKHYKKIIRSLSSKMFLKTISMILESTSNSNVLIPSGHVRTFYKLLNASAQKEAYFKPISK
jgi:hypothetical protein